MPLSRHLGKTLHEVLPPAVARQLESSVQAVFDRDQPVSDVEISVAREQELLPLTWIASAYPVHTTPSQLRWVGLIVMDASERKRSEEALRKTEKLAATGRLAASIAHEINNPLEAITNLLYLLTSHSGLEDTALGYAQMAEHEVRRIAEITQQTLRFLPSIDPPGAGKPVRSAGFGSDPAPGPFAESGHSNRKKIRFHDRSVLFCRRTPAGLCQPGRQRHRRDGPMAADCQSAPAGHNNWANSSQCGVRFQVSDTGLRNETKR